MLEGRGGRVDKRISQEILAKPTVCLQGVPKKSEPVHLCLYETYHLVNLRETSDTSRRVYWAPEGIFASALALARPGLGDNLQICLEPVNQSIRLPF